MCHFALDCLDRMHILVKKLEVHLGPDTADLAMRMGIHSGPVTAGVLRGDRSRFQLFGGTVNTAAKMESSGMRDRIQISNETAEILMSSGKGHWTVPRDDTVVTLGNGEREMKTFWLQRGDGSTEDSDESSVADEEPLPSASNHSAKPNVPVESAPAKKTTPFISASAEFEIQSIKKQMHVLDERLSRRVDWVAEQLCRLLKRIVAKRGGRGRRLLGVRKKVDESFLLEREGTVLEEVKELIALPKYDPTCKLELDAESIVLDAAVVKQVREYVAAIATMYRDNPCKCYLYPCQQLCDLFVMLIIFAFSSSRFCSP